jgi:hypothetical protein
MEALKEKNQRGTPEQLIYGVAKRLANHVFWDALLVFLPPLIVVLYCVLYLSFYGWISPASAALLGVATLGLATVAILMRYRPNIPSQPSAARLIDDRAGAQDRFLTLATLQGSSSQTSLMARLRAEAASLQSRIAVQREFPYKIKRSVYSSLAVSLAVVLLFHLLLPFAHSTLRPAPVHERLRDIAQKMATRPNLQEFAPSLQKLAAKLEDPEVLPQEKSDLAQQERKKIEEQEKKQSEKQDRDLLSQAAGTLEGIEQQSGAGEPKKDQEGAGGNIQSNLPQQGQGDGKENQGSGGSKGDDLKAQSDNELQNGKMAQGVPKEQGTEKAPGDKSAGNQSDSSNSAKDQSNNDRPGKTDGPGTDREGRNKVSEDIPQTPPPAERFNKPGEAGYQGIKGAEYVTVQLPEELAAEGKGGGQKKDGMSGKAANSQVPVSNVPLPKHVPDAPSEKQQMPLEYRGIIR